MSFSCIDIEQADVLIRTRQAQVVDIRDRASFEAGHIGNARHVDQQSVQQFIDSADRGLPLIVCCYHGNMSKGAADYFHQQGFAETYSLDGGYALWKQRADQP